MPTPCESGSLVFGAVGKYVSFAPSSDWAPGTNDFCVEWWQYQTQLTPPCCARVWQVGNWPAQNFGVSIENGNFLAWFNGSFIAGGNVANCLNTWTHFALVRKNGTVAIFQNGVRIQVASAPQNVSDTTHPLQIGYGSDMYWTGKLTNFHFVNGNAVYEPTNSTITVPTAPITPTTGTKLLLLASTAATYLTDSSGLNQVATNNGNVTWDAASGACPPTGIVSSAVSLKLGATSVPRVYLGDTLVFGQL